ncbi:MAG: hypothetical protein DI543_09535 [Bradyrhizobium icense]|nr:MAG: hypothetical protein DI543_09535 [Bradyrhizobium icense]
MGPEAFILTLWAAQVLLVLALTVRAALRREWAAAAGLVAGLAIGVAPMLAGQSAGPDPGAFLLRTSIILVAVSAIVLVVSYGFARRWIALALVIAIFIIPIVYSFIPAFSPLKVVPRLDAMGEIEFFLAPIACALASREVFVWARRLFANSKESAA